MSEKYIWIVSGATGQYSDYSEWNVAAFKSKEKADKFCQDCQIEADKVKDSGYEERDNFTHKHDPQFYMDYQGTSYSVEMVEIRD